MSINVNVTEEKLVWKKPVIEAFDAKDAEHNPTSHGEPAQPGGSS